MSRTATIAAVSAGVNLAVVAIATAILVGIPAWLAVATVGVLGLGVGVTAGALTKDPP